MKNLIKINLNQTVSKTELKEKKQNIFQWGIFSFMVLGLLGLITWIIILIVNINVIITDQNITIAGQKEATNAIKSEDADISEEDVDISKEDLDENKNKSPGISVEDVNHLKKFQENRIFWGPKLTALIESVPNDMVITEINLSSGMQKRNFEMEVHLRHDRDLLETDAEEYIKNSPYHRGKELVENLKGNSFIDHFNTDESNEPLLSVVKYEDTEKKGNDLHRIEFQGELKQYYKKI